MTARTCARQIPTRFKAIGFLSPRSRNGIASARLCQTQSVCEALQQQSVLLNAWAVSTAQDYRVQHRRAKLGVPFTIGVLRVALLESAYLVVRTDVLADRWGIPQGRKALRNIISDECLHEVHIPPSAQTSGKDVERGRSVQSDRGRSRPRLCVCGCDERRRTRD